MDTVDTISFLYAFDNQWDEDNALGYLRKRHKNIPQYAKFPFTTIRMAANHSYSSKRKFGMLGNIFMKLTQISQSIIFTPMAGKGI